MAGECEAVAGGRRLRRHIGQGIARLRFAMGQGEGPLAAGDGAQMGGFLRLGASVLEEAAAQDDGGEKRLHRQAGA